jgi:hypothetical protein
MASYKDREAFIPYRREDIIELCIEDGHLPDSDAQKFRDFCSILVAYYHFKFHSYQERLKDNYAPFSPDAATKSRVEPTPDQLEKMETQLIDDFNTILERANYIPISKNSLKKAFEERSLISVNTEVDLNNFDELACYYRGNVYRTTQVQKLFRKVEMKINTFERVVLLIKFKNKNYFTEQGDDLEALDFQPGKTYLYFYKNIPKFDLELLFPNIKIKMTWKDRLMLIVPGIGAAVPVILKILPKLLIIVGAILFFTLGPSFIENLNVNEEDVRNIMPVLVAVLSLLIALGGFAYKQYSKYKSKHIKFRKKVTDTLFFKNMANNASVFQSLIDAAEEAECKEMILVYYHLLTSKKALTPQQLDSQIETWMDQKFDTKIDFDINGPIRNLGDIQGKLVENKKDSASKSEISLLKKDSQGNCHVLPLEKAKSLLDYVWDNIFDYT